MIKYLQKFYYNYKKRFFKKIKPLLGKVVMIALTYQCQCKCEHCGSHMQKKDLENELRETEIKELISESRKLGANEIYFFGGEPLLITKLPDYIRYARQKKLLVRFDTNGLLLDEDRVKKLKDAGTTLIGISIDSPYEHTHDKLRGFKGIFNKAINGIVYCKNYGIECFISTYATKENLRNGDLVKMIDLAQSFNVKIRIASPVCIGKWFNNTELALSEEDTLLLKSLLKEDTIYWEIQDQDNAEISFICAALEKRFFYITAYGDIQPCCFFPVNFGNIRKESIKKIVSRMWNSEIFIMQKNYTDCPVNIRHFIHSYVGFRQ